MKGICKPSLFLFVLFFCACSTTYKLTDRGENEFLVSDLKLENADVLEYKVGEAIREVKFSEIVLLSIPSVEPFIFNGRVFYPASIVLEDSTAISQNGAVRVEGFLLAKNSGAVLRIPFSEVRELKKQEKEEKKENEEKEEKPEDSKPEEKQEETQEAQEPEQEK